jgi:hypothetical protein
LSAKRVTGSESKESFPPVCRVCPWQELDRGDAGDCLNFKKLLCRLQPAAILERFYNFQGL